MGSVAMDSEKARENLGEDGNGKVGEEETAIVATDTELVMDAASSEEPDTPPPIVIPPLDPPAPVRDLEIASRAEVLKRVTRNGYELMLCPERFWADRDVVLAAVKKYGSVFCSPLDFTTSSAQVRVT